MKRHEELLKDRAREETEKGPAVEDEEEREVKGRNEQENTENDRKWCNDSFSDCKNHC